MVQNALAGDPAEVAFTPPTGAKAAIVHQRIGRACVPAHIPAYPHSTPVAGRRRA